MLHHGIPLLPRLLDGSLLVARGLVDPDKVRAMAERVTRTGRGAKALFRPLLLERALSSMAD